MTKINHIICDWDETLAHTLPAIKNSYDHVLTNLGLPLLSIEEIKQITSSTPKSEVFEQILFGQNIEDNITLKTLSGPQKLTKQQALDLIKNAENQYYTHREAHCLEGISLIEGVKSFLDFCASNGKNLYILSSKNPQYLSEEVKTLGIDRYFNAIYGSPRLSQTITKDHQKPNRGAFIALFDGNPPQPCECCVVGDGLADIKLAQNIGCPSIIINPKLEGALKTISEAPKKLEEIEQTYICKP